MSNEYKMPVISIKGHDKESVRELGDIIIRIMDRAKSNEVAVQALMALKTLGEIKTINISNNNFDFKGNH